jgi:hypothetical protein
MPSDVNQFADALSGVADVGAITLASPVADPTTAIGTTTTAPGTSLGVGAYLYAVTFVTGILKDDATIVVSGETLPSPTKSVTTTASNQVVSLSSIPNSSDATVVAKRIYRTAVGGAQLKLVATIPSAQTSYVDSIADASLGANVPTTNTTGTYISGARIINVPVPSASGDAANKSYVDSTTIGVGTANTDVELVKTLIQRQDTRSVTYSYTGSNITTITEKDGATTVKTTTINYSGGDVSSIVEVVGGKTITTTFAYTSGSITGATRTVV